MPGTNARVTWCTRRHIWKTVVYLLTQVGFFLAFTWPGFFLSTLRASTVITPAEDENFVSKLAETQQKAKAIVKSFENRA
jgi:hypothetical protein